MYVAEFSNNRIQKFNSNGRFIHNKVGFLKGNANGQLSNPNGVAVDFWEDVMWLIMATNRIQKFDSNRTFIQLGSKGSATDNSVSPLGCCCRFFWEDVYVAELGTTEYRNSTVMVHSSQGGVLMVMLMENLIIQ